MSKGKMDFPDQVANYKPGTPQAQPAQRVGDARYMYQIDRISEGTISSIVFGSASISEKKLQDHINSRAVNGYRLVFQVIEQKRTLLFAKRESLLLTFERRIR